MFLTDVWCRNQTPTKILDIDALKRASRQAEVGGKSAYALLSSYHDLFLPSVPLVVLLQDATVLAV